MFQYQIRESSLNNNYNPAIILLHGYGSDENDLFSFADYLPNKFTIISLRAPFETPMGGFCWFSINFNNSNQKWSDSKQANESISALCSEIDHLIEKHSLNPNQIDLMGFSQGAVISWCLLLDFPLKINRAICMSGYIDRTLLKKDINSYRDVTAYSSHGTNDEVIPFEWAKNSIESLKKNNRKVIFNTFNDSHNVSQENFQNMIKWL